jgi:hypothetical protein
MRNVVASLSLVSAIAAMGCAGTESATGPGQSGSQKVVWSIYFGTLGSGLDASVCSAGISLCGQIVNVDSIGAFHDVWSPTTPNLLQADGTLTATAVAATLRCVATSASGSLSAVPNGSEYIGTATLSGKTVPIRVVKGQGPCT